MQERDQKSGTSAAVIVAGGSGTRAGAHQGRPKQYCLIGGKPVLRQTLLAFAKHPGLSHVIVVIRPGDEELYNECIAGLESELKEHGGANLLPPVHGGATRQLSVAAGLKALEALKPQAVLIHDAARPFITAETIAKTLAALEHFDGAIASTPVTDTLKRAGEAGEIAETVARAGLWRAETPQTFHYDKIRAAHAAAEAQGRSDFTDDAALAEWRGLNVALVEGTSGNTKITTAYDLKMADLIQKQSENTLPAGLPDVRTGSGYDVHSFEEGDHVTLCGVKIPHTKKLNGHSDADAPLHALTDAILGTIGAGDIGDHFPPSDPQWRGAASTIFLKRAHELVTERGGVITNLDIMIVAEAPKIGPHREAMRAHIAQNLGISIDRVSVKATTNEKLGFVGRHEGLAAMATATVVFERGSNK